GVAGGAGGVDVGGAAGIGAAGGERTTSRAPRRSRIRKSPSRKSISLRSCWLISPTRYLIVRTSKGLGLFEASSATTSPDTTVRSPWSVANQLRTTDYGQNAKGSIKPQPAQVLRYGCQHLVAIGCDQYIIFNSHAAPSREVDPRF